MVNGAQMPFAEPDAAPALKRAIAEGRLEATTDPAIVATAEHVVVVIGTPVDEHLNPNQTAITKALGGCSASLPDAQLLSLGRTAVPGVAALGAERLAGSGLRLAAA